MATLNLKPEFNSNKLIRILIVVALLLFLVSEIFGQEYAIKKYGTVSTTYTICGDVLTVKSNYKSKKYNKSVRYTNSVVYKDYKGNTITVKKTYKRDAVIIDGVTMYKRK